MNKVMILPPEPKGKVFISIGEKSRKLLGKGFKPIPINTNQVAILKSLNTTIKNTTIKEPKTATQLAKELGKTHAGILYLLDPLIKAGVVCSGELPSGGVVYYLCVELAGPEGLTQELEEIKAKIEKDAGGKKIQNMKVSELLSILRDYPDYIRDGITKWVFEEGWKEQ